MARLIFSAFAAPALPMIEALSEAVDGASTTDFVLLSTNVDDDEDCWDRSHKTIDL